MFIGLTFGRYIGYGFYSEMAIEPIKIEKADMLEVYIHPSARNKPLHVHKSFYLQNSKHVHNDLGTYNHRHQL